MAAVQPVVQNLEWIRNSFIFQHDNLIKAYLHRKATMEHCQSWISWIDLSIIEEVWDQQRGAGIHRSALNVSQEARRSTPEDYLKKNKQESCMGEFRQLKNKFGHIKY